MKLASQFFVFILLLAAYCTSCMAHEIYEGEFDKFIGKKYWIIDPTHTTFYKDCTTDPMVIVNVKEGTSFIVKKIVGNRVDLHFDDGSNACLSESYIDFNPYYFSENDFTILDREAFTTLNKIGIGKNTQTWLKHPFKQMRGLSKVKLDNVRVFNGNVFMTINGDNHTFENIFDVMDTFYIGSIPKEVRKWSKKVLKAIADHKAFIGMTKDQVVASIGKPGTVNRTVGSWGTHEQWVYGESSYLYLQNGILTSFQD